MSLGRLFSKVFEAWFGMCFVLSLLLLYPIFYWALSNSSRFPIAFRLMRFWALSLQLSGGIRMEIEHEGQLPDGPFVIAPNHSSYIDIPLMYRVFKDYFVFMGKQELSSWPMFRIFFTKNMNISEDTPKLMRFKHGAFKLGIEMQIPIVPVTFLTNHRLNSMGLMQGRSGPGTSRVIVHEPISTIGLTEDDLPALRDKVFGIINSTLRAEGQLPPKA